MTLDRRVLLLLYLLLVVLRLIKNKKVEGSKAGDFKIIAIFNADKIQQRNFFVVGSGAVLQVRGSP